MARKRNGARSLLPADTGGAAPAPAKPSKPPRTKAEQNADLPATTERPVADSALVGKPFAPAPSFKSQIRTSFEPVSERDEIARLAYSYWEARGGRDGSAEEDWYRAEQEHRRRRKASIN